GVIGAFYFEESVDDFLLVPFAAPPPLVANGVIPGSLDYQRALIDNDNFALFTQWTYNATDALSLTAGVRYTEETKGIDIISFTVTPLTAPVNIPTSLNMPFTPGPGLNTSAQPFENKYESITGPAADQSRCDKAAMTYLTLSPLGQG